MRITAKGFRWIRKTIRFVLISMVMYIVAVFAFAALGIHLVNSNGTAYFINENKDIGIPSPDGEYWLIEMRDPTNQWIQYSVTYAGRRHLLFTTTDFLYYARFNNNPYWIGGSNDFCIPCSDTGNHIYRFVPASVSWADPTWIPD